MCTQPCPRPTLSQEVALQTVEVLRCAAKPVNQHVQMRGAAGLSRPRRGRRGRRSNRNAGRGLAVAAAVGGRGVWRRPEERDDGGEKSHHEEDDDGEDTRQLEREPPEHVR